MDLFPREEEGGGCELVGEGMTTLVGNGIITGFAGQAILSLGLSAWVFFLTKWGNMDITYPEGSIRREVERKRLEFASDILMIGSDIQTTLGISYMLTVFASVATMDTYHLHLVFDIVSFCGVSNTAAFVCWRFCLAKMNRGDDAIHRPSQSNHRDPDRLSYSHRRVRATLIFTAAYIALTILLGIRLAEWAPNQEPGRCYHSYLVTSPSAPHPAADQLYVAFTSSWLIIILNYSTFAGVGKRRTILALSFFQFPLHLYMTLALKLANQGKLEAEEEHENGWDFGQTTAVVLLGFAVVELFRKGRTYHKFQKLVEKHAAEMQAEMNDEEAGNAKRSQVTEADV